MIRVRGLRRRFGAREVLAGLSLDVPAGSCAAVVGRSGCGKSTLLRVLAGLDAGATAEEVVVEAPVGVVFQEPRLLPWEPVWRTVLLGPGRLRRADRPRALAALAEVGLADRADAWPGTLSGGEAQRVALARALARGPRVLLLDEPFAALDALTRQDAHHLLGRVRAGVTTVLVTHDVGEAVALADVVHVLAGGVVAATVDAAAPGARADVLGALGAAPAPAALSRGGRR